jgi:transposase
LWKGLTGAKVHFSQAVLDDYVAEDNLVRAVDAFVEGLDLGGLGFGRVTSLEQGRPSYHPATLLKIYVYGYLNRVPSSRRVKLLPSVTHPRGSASR